MLKLNIVLNNFTALKHESNFTELFYKVQIISSHSSTEDPALVIISTGGSITHSQRACSTFPWNTKLSQKYLKNPGLNVRKTWTMVLSYSLLGLFNLLQVAQSFAWYVNLICFTAVNKNTKLIITKRHALASTRNWIKNSQAPRKLYITKQNIHRIYIQK